MQKILIYTLIGIGVIYAYIKYMEIHGIFYPTKTVELTPQALDIAFEDIYIKAEGNILINSWFIPYNNAKYTLIFFHGNAGNIGHRLDKISLLREIGLNIFIIDYRGYGRSRGIPCEKGLYSDATSAYEYLTNARKIPPSQIILYGESLGSAAAINLAAKSAVKAIILEGAFSCGKEMAHQIFPFLPEIFFADTFNSLKNIPGVKAAKLFLHSKDDAIVPFRLAKKLFDYAPNPKFFIELKGSHNNGFLSSKDTYISAIKSFITAL